MTITPAIQDIIIGIVTSIITGTAVWLWQKTKQVQIMNRKAKMLGLSSGDECLVVLSKYKGQFATSHGDVDSMVEAIHLIHEIGCITKVAPFNEALEPPGGVTEICIGGIDSNERTRVHLVNYLRGIHVNSNSDADNPSAIINIKTSVIYKYDKGKDEYALLAKFQPIPKGKPVVLICGQTALANKGAIHFLAKNLTTIENKYGKGKFCFILRVLSPLTYGHRMVEQVEDVTESAF